MRVPLARALAATGVFPRVFPRIGPRVFPRALCRAFPRVFPRAFPGVFPRISPRVFPRAFPGVPRALQVTSLYLAVGPVVLLRISLGGRPGAFPVLGAGVLRAMFPWMQRPTGGSKAKGPHGLSGVPYRDL